MSKETGAIVLAGGYGSRMKNLEVPKALCEIGGKPLLAYALCALGYSRFGQDSIFVVVGHQKEAIIDFCQDGTVICNQEVINGNLGALEVALARMPDRFSELLVLHADDCLSLSPEVIRKLLKVHEETNSPVSLLLSHDYRSEAHRKHYILHPGYEVTGALPIHSVSGELNVFTGVYCFQRQFVEENISLVQVNPAHKNERTATSLFEVALKDKAALSGLLVEGRWWGINTPEELVGARNNFRR